ncbi:amino acid/amide ABC transporter substrate-binding protein, HAAT family [Tistlia consotensis]|uniref:Amino acid/amide ABC transporter substrate-binding protein, HAAT family n=1 Tax=Tistlia consotensis USBA 355 TaxID=560819 RepID=A0A1Y6BH47_9PROT|nr:ABC transporter substrate-binding protein [Tistlia consotensis]SMF09696.1 amino acid/amide ABC transporter substrate-binding protein, HAAT family [Tistlia consotensis USBA 355]SNR34308.1 amino acid/amide ABC transporter substrate-binding protein, HAAT family [Tistlia consotensis]
MILHRSLAAAALAAGVVFAGSALADPGVSADKIVFGQSAALDGPAAKLGQGMRLGLMAAFDEANRNGGIGGRKLELVSRDDGYEPERAVENTKALIEQDQVFALIGPVGTPTSKAAQPVATDAGVPFVGAFTGAGFLRDPALKNVINLRGTYDAETESWIEHLTKDLGYSKIAILYQDDSFGRAGLSGVQKAMDKRGLKLAAEGTYQRNTVAVKQALLDIRKASPQAVVIVGAYKPAAEFIHLARKIKLDATFVNISFVGSLALAKELGADGAGVVVTQVVPFPWDHTIPAVAAYQAALKAYDAKAEPEFVSLEGYLVGRLAIAALEKAGAEPTRQSFLDAVYNTGTFDLGGVTLTYGPGDNQGMDRVFLTVIQPDGSFKAVDTLGGSS